MDYLHYIAQGMGLFSLLFLGIFMLIQYFVFRLLDRPFRNSGKVQKRLPRKNWLDQEIPEREGVLEKLLESPRRGWELNPMNSEFEETIEKELDEPSNWFNPKRRFALWARKTLWGFFSFLCTLEFAVAALILHALGYIHLDF